MITPSSALMNNCHDTRINHIVNNNPQEYNKLEYVLVTYG